MTAEIILFPRQPTRCRRDGRYIERPFGHLKKTARLCEAEHMRANLDRASEAIAVRLLSRRPLDTG